MLWDSNGVECSAKQYDLMLQIDYINMTRDEYCRGVAHDSVTVADG